MSRPTLAEIQRWAMTVVTHPAGPGAGLAEAGTDHASLSDLIETDNDLEPIARLRIYSRNYRLRLVESLGDQYRILKKIVGEKLFDQFAAQYIHEKPPSGYSLHQLGADFPAWLAETRPKGEAWAHFITELAELECTFETVYNGPGHESEQSGDRTPPIALLSFTSTARTLHPSPSLCLRRFHFSVDTYFTAVRAGKAPEHPSREDIRLAIYRTQWRVRFYRLDEPGWQELTSVLAKGWVNPSKPADTVRFLTWLELGLLHQGD